ncbi:hypothetical protein HN784_00465 [bacterium]|jgi:mannose-6-phosphate isomerase-like protein (cupin superfamily)|nr:hypothetical protein [bacterium]MBT4251384.1 hypothetical protein [bacterium]MBT4598120.1 hypothetical protein [bacterium]MBT6754335.1 hypothetical protein [bacterium]MBT7037258.1 hypothetical protein [bacterium]
MKITKKESTKENWEGVKSRNYKIKTLEKNHSVVYAELKGVHGKVKTKGIERIYYILEGEGFFDIEGVIKEVGKDDVITIPPCTEYDYAPLKDKELKILLFMEFWDN